MRQNNFSWLTTIIQLFSVAALALLLMRLWPHDKNPPKSVALSKPDKNVVAPKPQEKTAPPSSNQLPDLIKTLPVSQHIRKISYSPDRKVLAVSGEDNVSSEDRVDFYDTHSWSLLKSLPGTTAVYSDDGRFISAGAFLYDAKTYRLKRIFTDNSSKGEGFPGVFGPTAISSNGRYVATCGEDPNVKWFPPQDTTRANTEANYSRTFAVKLWNARTGRRLRVWRGHSSTSGGTTKLVFSRDARFLVSIGPNRLDVWNVRTGKIWKTMPAERHSAFSAQKMLLAVEGYNNKAQLTFLNLSTGKSSVWAFPLAQMYCLGLSPDGRLLATCGIEIWNTQSKTRVLSIPNYSGGLTDLIFSPDNKTLTSGSNLGLVCIWKLK